MVKKIGIALLLILIAQGLFAFGNKEAEDPRMEPGDTHSLNVEDKMEISWTMGEDTFEVEVSAKTTGWISIGFDPSYKMKGANIIIGYIKDGEIVMRDDYGTGPFQHASDESLGGTNDITDISGTEENGTTTLSFSIPNKSDDKYDNPFVHGNSCTLIVAYGKNGGDDFKSIHAFRKVVTITLN